METEFEQELQRLINKHSVENQSHTPDFVLAQFLRGCLEVWNATIAARDKWWSFDPWRTMWEGSGLDPKSAPKPTYEVEDGSNA